MSAALLAGRARLETVIVNNEDAKEPCNTPPWGDCGPTT